MVAKTERVKSEICDKRVKPKTLAILKKIINFKKYLYVIL